MLVDDITIKVQAGKGGKGAVAFNKNMMSLGPAGGSGGRGGNVYVEGVVDISRLRQFRFKKTAKAEDGQNGKPQFNDGHDGQDLVLQIPVGTVVHDLTKKTSIEVIKIGERQLISEGGKGGKGNFHFRGPHNTSPRRFQPGLPGEAGTIRFELKLIADVGLIGLPNAGKSSLLNELTNAKSKVANYPFTTLAPNLGVYYELVLADIPGLIEGASIGKGLGIKFLRHIERTKVLFHLISGDSEHPRADYEIIRKELTAYNPALSAKPEYIFISKSDLLSEEAIDGIASQFSDRPAKPLIYSIHDAESLEGVKKLLNQLIKEKHAQE